MSTVHLDWIETPRGWRLVPSGPMDPDATALAEAVNDRLLEAVALQRDGYKECTSQRLWTAEVRYLAEAYRHPLRRVCGWCDSPIYICPGYRPGYGKWVILAVACRRCRGCRRSKSAHWAARAALEMAGSQRTWFVTLTLGPRARAIRRIALAVGSDPDADAAAHLTRLLDRLRHSHGVRYLVGQEAHKDGVPHWHLLVHEMARPLRYAQIVAQWGQGYVHARLADAEAAAYVSKYVSKDMTRRVRSSRSYGIVGAGDRTSPVGRASPAGPRAAADAGEALRPPSVTSVDNIADTWDVPCVGCEPTPSRSG